MGQMLNECSKNEGNKLSNNMQEAEQIMINLEDESDCGIDRNMYLFTTKTCPNCNIAKEYLKDFSYEVIDAQENIELTEKYNIFQAPTLVVVEDGVTQKYINASKIREFVEQQLVVMG